jgi:hypothetical protein
MSQLIIPPREINANIATTVRIQPDALAKTLIVAQIYLLHLCPHTCATHLCNTLVRQPKIFCKTSLSFSFVAYTKQKQIMATQSGTNGDVVVSTERKAISLMPNIDDIRERFMSRVERALVGIGASKPVRGEKQLLLTQLKTPGMYTIRGGPLLLDVTTDECCAWLMRYTQSMLRSCPGAVLFADPTDYFDNLTGANPIDVLVSCCTTFAAKSSAPRENIPSHRLPNVQFVGAVLGKDDHGTELPVLLFESDAQESREFLTALAQVLSLEERLVPHMRGWHTMMAAKQRYDVLHKSEDSKSSKIIKDKELATIAIVSFFRHATRSVSDSRTFTMCVRNPRHSLVPPSRRSRATLCCQRRRSSSITRSLALKTRRIYHNIRSTSSQRIMEIIFRHRR